MSRFKLIIMRCGEGCNDLCEGPHRVHQHSTTKEGVEGFSSSLHKGTFNQVMNKAYALQEKHNLVVECDNSACVPLPAEEESD